MLRKIALFLCIGLLFMQCGSGKNELGEKPDNLVAPDKMVGLLVQIHLAEARVGKLSLANSDSAAIVFKRLQNKAFTNAQVDTSAYSKSYIYYSSHPAELAQIYEQVVNQLKTAQEKKQEELRRKPTKRPLI